MANDFDENFFAFVEAVLGFKIKASLTEVIYFAGGSSLLGQNIMGNNRFMPIAFMLPSFNICAQFFPLSSSMAEL
jgi:hypothetical protein